MFGSRTLPGQRFSFATVPLMFIHRAQSWKLDTSLRLNI